MRVSAYESNDEGLLWSSDTVQVRQASVSSMDNNVFLMTCRRTGDQALIDAADDLDQILSLVQAGTGSVASIVTTHRHWDHVRALSAAVSRTGARTYAGTADADHLPVPTDVPLRHGDVVAVGDLELRIIGLRGHTPGSIALEVPGGDGSTLLITGDSLFPGGPGATQSSTDFTSLMDDLEARVFSVYADSTLVLPGHGDGTTLGAERPFLQDWRRRGW